MKKLLIGRNREIARLNEYLDSDRSEFIAVYGRRRVGKTFLIRHVIGDKACFSLAGMENAEMKDQLNNFYFSMRKYSSSVPRPSSWIEAFFLLESYLENLPDGRKIIFIDELPWLDTVRSSFVAAFEHFWNAWAEPRDDVKLIVCGSATSWMTDHIINNRGGLHNRITHQIYLPPFTLSETEEYFKSYGFSYARKEIAECYMVMGGIPYYYSLMSSKESVAQNIDRLFFSRQGELNNEFTNLYRSLFKKSDEHIAIVTALAVKAKGLTRNEILMTSNVSNNSKFTRSLDELEKCGFIRSYVPFMRTKRDLLYQLTDAYSLFYLKFQKENIYQDEKFWTLSFNTPRINAWRGYAFENLCLNHVPQIKLALGISGVQSRVCSWVCKPEDNQKGAQIDLIIDRADRTVNLCEIKYYDTPYKITKQHAEELDNKLHAFIHKTATTKSIILTLIATYGIQQNQYSGSVHSVITLDDLFVPLTC